MLDCLLQVHSIAKFGQSQTQTGKSLNVTKRALYFVLKGPKLLVMERPLTRMLSKIKAKGSDSVQCHLQRRRSFAGTSLAQ